MPKTVKNSSVVPVAAFFLVGESCKPRVVPLPLSASLYPHFLTWGLQRGAVILNISICHWGQWHFRSSGLTWFEPGQEKEGLDVAWMPRRFRRWLEGAQQVTGAGFLLEAAATRGEIWWILYSVGASQARGPGLRGRHRRLQHPVVTRWLQTQKGWG